MGLHSLTRTLYIDDNGVHFQFKQQEQLRNAVGNTTATGTEPRIPSGVRPRKIHATFFGAGGPGQEVGKLTRSVVVGSVTNPLWTHTDADISLPDYDSVPGVGQVTPNVMQTFLVTGRTGEQATF